MTVITATQDSRRSTAIYGLELFDTEEVLQLSGEWTEELRYHSQAEELGIFSGIFRGTLEVAMKMRSVIHMISEYLRHASDRCLTDLDGMFHILSPSRRLPLCI